eukprot:GHVS01064362.1.p1 GENE.GHVS01064362.1~~GHVS01064362.1.p1  ORF type:complete len:348 (+),score=52.89 GHVS01064362.1:149-1192(+)
MFTGRLREFALVMVQWEEALRTASCVLYISVFCSLYIYICLFKLLWLDVNIAEVLRGPAEERRRRRVWRRLRRLQAVPGPAIQHREVGSGEDWQTGRRGRVESSEEEPCSTDGFGRSRERKHCLTREHSSCRHRRGQLEVDRRGGQRCQNTSKGNKSQGQKRGSTSLSRYTSSNKDDGDRVAGRRQEGRSDRTTRGGGRGVHSATTDSSPGQVSPGQVSPGQVSPGQVSSGQVSPWSSETSSISSDSARPPPPHPNVPARRPRRQSSLRRRVREVRGQVEISLFGWRVRLFELSPDPFAWLLPPCVLVGLSLALIGWLHFFGSMAKLATNLSEDTDDLWVGRWRFVR